MITEPGGAKNASLQFFFMEKKVVLSHEPIKRMPQMRGKND